MIGHKLSSSAKRMMSEVPEAEADREVSLLVRTAGTITSDLETAIEHLGGRVRTRAGDVASLSIPLRQLDALSELEAVLYVEAAEPLYPEAPPKDVGE